MVGHVYSLTRGSMRTVVSRRPSSRLACDSAQHQHERWNAGCDPTDAQPRQDESIAMRIARPRTREIKRMKIQRDGETGRPEFQRQGDGEVEQRQPLPPDERGGAASCLHVDGEEGVVQEERRRRVGHLPRAARSPAQGSPVLRDCASGKVAGRLPGVTGRFTSQNCV